MKGTPSNEKFDVFRACGSKIRKILGQLRVILALFIAPILTDSWQRPSDQIMPEVT